MAEFDFEKWFKETYENPNAPKHSEYNAVKEKTAFKEKMIAKQKVINEALAVALKYSSLKDFGDSEKITEEKRQERINAIKTFLQNSRNAYLVRYPSDKEELNQAILDAFSQNEDIAKSTFVNSYKKIEENFPTPAAKPLDLRTHTSDQNQQRLTGTNTQYLNNQENPYSLFPLTSRIKNFTVGIDIAVLHAMGKVNDAFISQDPEKQDPLAMEQQIKALKAQIMANPEERKRFHDLEAGAAQQIIDTYPPQRLVDTAQWLTEAGKQENNNDQKLVYAHSLKLVIDAMKQKIHALASGTAKVNQSNIADVYDGAMAMLKYVTELPEEYNRDNQAALEEEIKKCLKKLEDEIKIYDEQNGFSNLTEDDANKIGDTYRRAVSLSGLDKEEKEGKFGAPAEFKDIWGNINITDDNGQPITDEKKRQEFINSFNEAAKKEAVRNVAVKHKGASKKQLQEALDEELSNVYTEHFTKLIMTNEAGQGHTNPDMEEIIKMISEGKDANGQPKKYGINNKAGIAHFAQYTNDNAGYLHRLGSKIGQKAPVLAQMQASVKKFDKTCIARFDPAYSQAKKFSKALGTSALWQAANMAARYGSMFVPGGNFVYAGYVLASSAGRLWYRYKAQEKQAAAQGKKLKIWDFIKKSKTELANMAMLIAGAASGVQYLASAASAVAGLGGLYKGFNAARKNGDSKSKAFGKSILNLGTSLTAAAVAGFGLHGIGEATGLNDYMASATGHSDTYDPNNSQVVKDPSDELKDMTQDELAKNGYHKEICNPGDEGAFLASKAEAEITTHDYNLKSEHAYAEARMGDSNSNFQAPESSHGLRHIDSDPNTLVKHGDPDNYYSHATSSLDTLAKDHTEMNTYNPETGELVPNSEILAYKVYQLNHLIPNSEYVLKDLDGQPTAAEYYSYTNADGSRFTYQDLETKLASGDALSEKDFELLMKIEQGVGMQNEGGVNSVGMVAYTGIDKMSYGHGGYVDPGFDNNTRAETLEVYNRISETNISAAQDIVLGITFLDHEGDRRQEQKDRIGANAGNAEYLTEQEKRAKEATDRIKAAFKKPVKESSNKEDAHDAELNAPEKESWLKRQWRRVRDKFSSNEADAVVTATNTQQSPQAEAWKRTQGRGYR